jgi:hypothetical protein
MQLMTLSHNRSRQILTDQKLFWKIGGAVLALLFVTLVLALNGIDPNVMLMREHAARACAHMSDVARSAGAYRHRQMSDLRAICDNSAAQLRMDLPLQHDDAVSICTESGREYGATASMVDYCAGALLDAHERLWTTWEAPAEMPSANINERPPQ